MCVLCVSYVKGNNMYMGCLLCVCTCCTNVSVCCTYVFAGVCCVYAYICVGVWGCMLHIRPCPPPPPPPHTHPPPPTVDTYTPTHLPTHISHKPHTPSPYPPLEHMASHTPTEPPFLECLPSHGIHSLMSLGLCDSHTTRNRDRPASGCACVS